MADAALFIGWGEPVRGREQRGIDVFNEALAYYGAKQEAGAIESSEVVLITPHGGDLSGFILIRGSQQQINDLRLENDFELLNTRAAQVVTNFGVVDAAVGEGIGRAIGMYEEAIGELA